MARWYHPERDSGLFPIVAIALTVRESTALKKIYDIDLHKDMKRRSNAFSAELKLTRLTLK